MHSQNFLRQSHLLLKNSPSNPSQLRRLCLLRLNRAAVSPNHHARSLSTPSPAETAPSDEGAAPSNPAVPEDNGGAESAPTDVGTVHAEELAKIRVRRSPRASISSKDSESIELPQDLNLFWLPEDLQSTPTSNAGAPNDLPPPEILDEALNNLLITLHPKIQHRAAYPPNADLPIEPTLGLYCPIEGGDYIIDATVRELARRIDAEVIVLDSVQLAAGEWGQFGKAANSLQLPMNPLKFPASSPGTQVVRPESMDADFEGEDDASLLPTQQMMTLTLLTPPQLSQGRSLISSSARRSPTRSKIQVFFDTLINSMPPPYEASAGNPTPARPRIVYIRDFTTLAATSSVWYAPLLAAVRQRRRGPMSRPSSAISNPMTIVFGMTPSLFAPATTGSSGSSNIVNFLMNQNSPGMSTQESKPEKVDWSESEQAERARERRLQDRLRKWEKSEASLINELPRLSTNADEDSMDASKPDVIVIGAPSGRGLPPMLGPSGRSGRAAESEKKSFFRTSVLVPAERSHSLEKKMRLARRREINELSIRMGVGAIGGSIEQTSASTYFDRHSPNIEASIELDVTEKVADERDSPSMWEEWGSRIEVWPNVKKTADNAVGQVLSASGVSVPSLESTIVPWSSVQSAWKAQRVTSLHRKNWLKDFGVLNAKEAEQVAFSEEQPQVDEIVERVRNEADLDPYEQRLLGCIVDAASMPTSFNQVHLPPHVIDSVRTIVSLPLLHPHAFQQGILKQHGMTGCLLFGPPGTGKTLVVRALAKEAGCRMLVITPSDIMDMYVGEAEKLVRATFSLARRLAPCVIFMDEIDALFGARMAARESGGAAAAHRGVITEFMQEMDGLKSSREDGIIVIGATNRPFDLDDAILRRLPRKLLVDLPGEKEREEILKILLRDEMIGPDVTPQLLAQKTESFSGSDLKHLCVSAALDAVKEHVRVPWLSALQINITSDNAGKTESVPAERSASNQSAVEIITSDQSSTPSEVPSPPAHSRTLHLRNFLKALKEITPSSSESLGSLSDLRKWNEEFGEGRNDRRRKQVWGKGRFGFIDERSLQKVEEGKVAQPPSPSGSLELP